MERKYSPEEGYKEYLGSRIVSVLGLICIGAGLVLLKTFGIYILVFGILMILVGVYFYLKRF